MDLPAPESIPDQKRSGETMSSDRPCDRLRDSRHDPVSNSGKSFRFVAGWGLEEVADPGFIPIAAKKWKKKGRKALVRWIRAISNLSKNQAKELADRLLVPSVSSMSVSSPAVVRQDRQEFDRELQRQKMLALQQLAYGASHEINNPLANIATRAQSLIAGEPDQEKRQKLVVIYEQSLRAHEMISDLMLFANPPALQLQTIDLRNWLPGIIRQVEQWLQIPSALLFGQGNFRGGASAGDSLHPPTADAAAIQFRTLIPVGRLIVSADPTQLNVLLLGLIRNSIESLRNAARGGWIELRISRLAEGDWLFSVTDDGPGISAEIAGFVFNPFFSGREAGRGLGFGLPKAWRIAEAHGGELRLTQTGPSGARFEFRLPALPRPAVDATCQPAQTCPRESRENTDGQIDEPESGGVTESYLKPVGVDSPAFSVSNPLSGALNPIHY